MKQKPVLFVSCRDKQRAASLSRMALELATLTNSSAVEFLAEGAPVPESCGVKICDDVTTVYLLLKASRHSQQMFLPVRSGD